MIIKKNKFFLFFMCDENLIDKWLNARKIEEKDLLKNIIYICKTQTSLFDVLQLFSVFSDFQVDNKQFIYRKV